MLKRTHTSVYHKLNPKHLHCYIQKFAAKHNVREEDNITAVGYVAAELTAERLMYWRLIADNRPFPALENHDES